MLDTFARLNYSYSKNGDQMAIDIATDGILNYKRKYIYIFYLMLAQAV